ncbi:MAG: 50S ribosomal protein L35 [Chloroflexi bacterium]|nr:50S ribosomal protein L35 [Chloroflexota bacterium]
MPKLKTHKGAKKRLHLTGTGKLMRVKGGKSHLRRKKSKAARRLYDKKLPVHPADAKRLARLLPGS